MKYDDLRLSLTARKTMLQQRTQQAAQDLILARERLRRAEQADQTARGALESHTQTMAEIEALAAKEAPSAQIAAPAPASGETIPVAAAPTAPAA